MGQVCSAMHYVLDLQSQVWQKNYKNKHLYLVKLLYSDAIRNIIYNKQNVYQSTTHLNQSLQCFAVMWSETVGLRTRPV